MEDTQGSYVRAAQRTPSNDRTRSLRVALEQSADCLRWLFTRFACMRVCPSVCAHQRLCSAQFFASSSTSLAFGFPDVAKYAFTLTSLFNLDSAYVNYDACGDTPARRFAYWWPIGAMVRGPTPSTSAPGLGPLRPHLRRDWARR